MKEKKIVCMGGGIGNYNLLRGLKQYTDNISVIVSMADNGGSAGRLRRLYNIHPPGDIISCLAALTPNDLQAQLLVYRLPGDRYAEDHVLPGHKVGNIMLAAATQMTGSMDDGIAMLKELFAIKSSVYPATIDQVSLSAKTVDGIIIEGEENIDLGNYSGARVLAHLWLQPKHPKVADAVVNAISQADVIIASPGDLYTALLPILLVSDIQQAFLAAKARKLFVVNVANKPFETRGYHVEDFIAAIDKHIGSFPFQDIIMNTNYSIPMPQQYKYEYVTLAQRKMLPSTSKLIEADLLNESFPIYHDEHKLAKIIWETI